MSDFEQIYLTYSTPIHRYLIRLIGAKEAEDLAQEVFIKAEKGMDTFRNEAQVTTWLYRIATNAAVDRMRAPSFRREIDLDTVVEATSDSAASLLPTEDNALRNATNECIRGIINKLPENYRVPVILSEMESMQNQEIADIPGVSLEVVKARLHRGKARLKKELLQACQFSRDARNELTCDPKGKI